MYVSIHLMLQFIMLNTLDMYGICQFQYISCCSLSITSRMGVLHWTSVSIHLMLQFIVKVATGATIDTGFTTSHVVVYQWEKPACSTTDLVSIHLMLQFILSEEDIDCVTDWFQYISCCSLSFKVRYICVLLNRFNTSHVVVYLPPFFVDMNLVLFQYISCCSLSGCISVMQTMQ